MSSESNCPRNACPLDLKEVEQFLREMGYEVVRLEQPWRHVTGVVNKEGKKYFFKMASSQAVGLKTRNEYFWDKLLNERGVDLPLKIPKVYESGEWRELFWFISDLVEGRLLASPQRAVDDDLLSNNLETIAKGAEAIMNLPIDIDLPNNADLSLEERKENFLSRIREWMEQFPQDVSKLYEFIKENVEAYLSAPSHGDFAPWHILADGDNHLTLIDGEHGKINGVKFYDVAYFYHRVYTALQRPDLADKFLQFYLNIHPMTPAEKLCFKVILAQRVIGGYFDAHNDKTETAIHDELAERVLNDEIM
jgi:hypothetical protein